MNTLKAAKLDLFRRELQQFVVFTGEEWALFITFVNFITLKKKEHFAQEGRICDHIAFVAIGSVRYYHVKDGEEITGYFSFEREFVSSYKSFLTRQPALNYIQALEETELISITYMSMQQLYTHPVLAYKMERFGRLVAEFYLLCYEERIASFITQTPEERYSKLLETGREILQRIPQHYIANFLGITPVSLSRIRRRMLKSA
ncbi:Crp/Fnr family transcriptional regulator [soil metagenome]|jgi:CRP-like cAMP-binding protein